MSFTHLHVHTTYSLLDGFSDVKKLIRRTQEMGMNSIAITDHGTMFGVIEFFNAARTAGVKPIIGLETYLSARGMRDRDGKLDKQSSHLLLLAENAAGYKNLLAIASAGQLEGFYYYPRIDKDFLAKHSEGLIATTGCMAADVPRALVNEGVDAARKKLDWYFDVFGKDNFFFELQQHDIKELPAINKALVDLGPRYQAHFIATNDVHYVNPDDARLQDILLAIQTNALLSDPNRFQMTSKDYYLRSPDEMRRLFAEVPEALSNTLLIAERCNVDLSTKGYHLPDFQVPEGEIPQTYLRRLCEEGIQQRYGARANQPTERQRLDYELEIIHTMGFDTYFLIVWDLCRQARQEGIWYNARGSAGGSIVAYCLDITLVEPLEQGLIFERFLNPGRISMPDIDLDFQDDQRARMMQYTADKYGSDKVAQIITFGTLGARAALRDVGRVMDIPLNEVDRVAKLVPNIPGNPVTIARALVEVEEFKAVYNEQPQYKILIDTASDMEGTVRNAGTHAAGVVISDRPVIDYVPLHRPTNDAIDTPIKTVTQFEMNILESLGILKVDFLGLATLTIMQRACDLIRERHGVIYTINTIPTDNPETYEFISSGRTAGVFQLEGSGMTRFIVQMKPKSLANVIAMVALYRPGPLEFIPSYIRRMHGEEEVTYRHEAMEPIFKETYGIPIYQEQIMFAAMGMAGYTASEADDLRKAIAKKKADVLLKHREKFIKGAQNKGIGETTAQQIFDDWENFARYGFPKAHAADYGVIAVQTAYLKANYTVEYMTALLTASRNETEKIALYTTEARSMGVEVLPPDINASLWDFTIEDRSGQKSAVRFGLGAVKNVGQNAVELIIQARQNGPFADLNDLAHRVDLRGVGKRSLECLIKVGALDRFGLRQAILLALEQIVSISSSHFRSLESGQLSLFGANVSQVESIRLSKVPKVDPREGLTWERELIGMYLSSHPLGPFVALLKRRVTHFAGQLGDTRHKEKIVVGGMVSRMRPHLTKTGKSMGFVTLEDIQGLIEVVVFPRTWDACSTDLQQDVVVLVEGSADNEGGGEAKVLADKVIVLTLEDAEADAKLPLPQKTVYQAPPPTIEEEVIAPEQEGGTPWGDLEMPPPPDNFEDGDWLPQMAVENAILHVGEVAELSAPIRTTLSVAPTAPVESQLLLREAPQLPAALPVISPTPDPLPGVEEPEIAEIVPLYVLPPAPKGRIAEAIDDDRPHLVTVTLHPSGDRDRDVRRMRRIHGALVSCPGKDRFAFQLFENGRFYLLEFPNSTTGLTNELISRLIQLAGEGNVRVDVVNIL